MNDGWFLLKIKSLCCFVDMGYEVYLRCFHFSMMSTVLIEYSLFFGLRIILIFKKNFISIHYWSSCGFTSITYINWHLSNTHKPWILRLEDGAVVRYQEFQRWHNGGGTFHKSACIDPTALIEMGAIVHPKSVVGAYVHIGSGTVIGPSVTIGQLTKIGWSFFFMQQQRYCN